MMIGRPITFSDLYFVDPQVFDEMENLLQTDPPSDLKFVCGDIPLRKGGQNVSILKQKN
jgi:hypothetical protein